MKPSQGKLQKKNKGTSGFRQFGILTGRYAELLWNDRQRLALLLIQPLLIAILLKIVADKDIFKIYEKYKVDVICIELFRNLDWNVQFDSGNMQRTCNSEKRIYVEFEATVLYDVKICTAGITGT